MALTVYLLQSIIGTLLYYGYGLGLQFELGYLSSFLLSLVVFALLAVLSHWWLRHFRFGPFEWLYGLLLIASTLLMADMARLHTYIRPLSWHTLMPGHNGLFARQFPIASTYFEYSDIPGFD